MKKRISYILFLIATIIWGFAFVAQKNATLIPPFAVGAIRSGMAVLFLLALIPFTDRLTKNGRRLLHPKTVLDFNKNEIVGGCVLGVIITVASTFQQYGIEDTDAGKAAFITALYVVIVPILSSLFGRKPSIFSLVSIPIAIIGFYFLCVTPGESFVTSDLMILVCAAIFACHIVSVDRLSPGCDGVRMSCIQFLCSWALNTVMSLIVEGLPVWSDVLSVMPSLLFLGIGSSGIAYTLQIIGQKDADPTVSSIILSLESVFGVIGGALILGENLNLREYLGCAVVFAAVLMAQIEPNTFKKIIDKLKKEV